MIQSFVNIPFKPSDTVVTDTWKTWDATSYKRMESSQTIVVREIAEAHAYLSDDDHDHDHASEEPEQSNEVARERRHSYSKIMYNHTRSQLSSLHTSTIPSYSRTMFAFTQNQLGHCRLGSLAVSLTGGLELVDEDIQVGFSGLGLDEQSGVSSNPVCDNQSSENRRNLTAPARVMDSLANEFEAFKWK